MISIKRSLGDYERAQCLVSGLTETVRAILENMRHYAVEPDSALTEQFRSWVDRLTQHFETCLTEPDEQSFQQIRTSVRAGLRDYHDRAERYIGELRDRLAATMAAMNEMLASLVSGDTDGESRLKEEITKLTSLEQSGSLDEIRSGLHWSVVSLSSCVQEMRHEKDLVITQLRDEIRTLQHSLEEARRAATTDAITGVYNRQAFQEGLLKELSIGCNAAIICITLQNLRSLTGWYTSEIIDQLLAAVVKRARNVLPEEATLGRWKENVFCAVVASAAADELVNNLTRQTGGNYVCFDGSEARTLCVHVTVTAYACPSGADAAAIAYILDGSKKNTRGVRRK